MGSRPSSLRNTVTSDVKILVAPRTELNVPSERSSETVTDEANDAFALQTGDNRSYLKEPLLVIAIDFGTTYSGYAFSFKGNKGKFFTANHCSALCDDRVPTIVLLNPDKTFNSFGYEAQEKYSKLGQQKETYFFCENFKMALYKTMKSSKNTEIKDSQNRPIEAKDIMVMLIENLLKLAFEIVSELQKGDITWIITVPASWSESAKQIIHQSVLTAGVNENNLRFVFEPYAASIHCVLDKYQVGHIYMLVDLGGGSADISVYEVQGERKLKELHRATNDSVGGLSVNSEFKILIEALLGPAVWSEFQRQHATSFLDFMRAFERKKRIFSNQMDTITMSIENSLLQILEEKTGETLKDVIEKSNFKDKIRFKSELNKISFKKEIFENLFKPSVDGILDVLEDNVNACRDLDLRTMFLVGGYSESPYLREKIQSRFSDLKVVFHKDAKLAVLKGAVMLGYERQ